MTLIYIKPLTERRRATSDLPIACIETGARQTFVHSLPSKDDVRWEHFLMRCRETGRSDGSIFEKLEASFLCFGLVVKPEKKKSQREV